MKNILITTLFLLLSVEVFAQETVWVDSLQAAVKVDVMRNDTRIDHLNVNADRIKAVVSPIGEGDPIRWVQALPGVTTGADGTASFYVRGGNIGNTLFSLDGVQVYGYSHLLGLTTIVPQQVIKNASLRKGGFEGNESNFTASHLSIETKTPNNGLHANASLNNFLFSAGSEGWTGKRFSYVFNARISPLTPEYRAIRSALPGLLGNLDDFSAKVGDVYAKLRYEIGKTAWIEASSLGSIDDYAFSRNSNGRESMGWNNAIGLVRVHSGLNNGELDVSASINRYASVQTQDKVFRGERNYMSLKSALLEATLSADRVRRFGNRMYVGYGGKLRLARFNPGQVASVSNKATTVLSTIYAQCEYSLPDKFDLIFSLRGNCFKNNVDGSTYCNPEGSLSAKWQLGGHVALEGSFDRIVQYYHTLEGLPVGWSLDIIVPSGSKVAPETALQGSIGPSFRFGEHTATVDGFYRHMNHLVYYKYAQTLFSSGMANWENDVDQGAGDSFGAEFLYEYQHDDFYARVSYTIAKTTRYGFQDIMDGGLFHARFDRTHVLNLLAEWKGLSTAFTLQSGNWENGAPEKYPLHTLGGEEWTSSFFSGVNNYHMPIVLRLDLGYQFAFKTGRVEHEVNLGVCNVTNHFNPFMIYYETSTESWKQLALLPVLPNFSWTIRF